MGRVDSRGCRAALNDLKAGLVQAAALALRSVVDAGVQHAKRTNLFNDQTGGTRKSIRGLVIGTRGFIEAGGASAFLVNGTKAHAIIARGNALAFVSTRTGEMVFRKRVWHPGTRPRPFMLQAKQEAQKVAPYAFDYFFDYAIRKFNRG